MVSTANFNPTTDKKLACTCGNAGCDKRVVLQSHLDRIQLVRDMYGKPMTVTSGGRCPLHVNEVHRTKPADHQKCLGVDIKCDGSNRGLLVKYALEAGCNAIGVAKTFVHMGYRPELEEGHVVMWTY